MKERWVLLKLAKLVDSHAAVFADASEIVAEEIDDHRILGAVFWAGEEIAFECRVFLRRNAAAASTFYR